MTIKQLKEKIKDLPDFMEVFVDERLTEYQFGMVNTAKIKDINITDEPDGYVLEHKEVLILSEN